MIPPTVVGELSCPDAPAVVRDWIETRPDWLIVRAPFSSADPRLAGLDSGERDALSLAMELEADLVLIDERDARSVAEQCGMTVAGTLRVLASAASQNLVDLAEVFARLRTTSFRADPKLFELLLERDAEHRRRGF